MVIVMKENKSLVISKETKIYQHETGVDFLHILLPLKYKGHDLGEFSWNLIYTDPQGGIHTELLEIQEDLYHETKYDLMLPVNTEITKYSGMITMGLTGTNIDADTQTGFVLKSGSIQIEISPVSDLYSYIPDETIGVIDQKMIQLDAKIKAIELLGDRIGGNTPDDLFVDENSKLHLSVLGEPIGLGVYYQKPDIDTDDVDDGIIDL